MVSGTLFCGPRTKAIICELSTRPKLNGWVSHVTLVIIHLCMENRKGHFNKNVFHDRIDTSSVYCITYIKFGLNRSAWDYHHVCTVKTLYFEAPIIISPD